MYQETRLHFTAFSRDAERLFHEYLGVIVRCQTTNVTVCNPICLSLERWDEVIVNTVISEVLELHSIGPPHANSSERDRKTCPAVDI